MEKKKIIEKKIIGLCAFVMWIIIGMFIGVGLYLMFKQPILAAFLFAFTNGLTLICFFLMRCFMELEKNE